MTQKKILLAVAIASTGMIFATGCARKDDKKPSSSTPVSPVTTQEAARANILSSGNQLIEKRAAIVRESNLDGHKAKRDERLAQLDKAVADQREVVANVGNNEEARNAAQLALDTMIKDQNNAEIAGSRPATLAAYATAESVANETYVATVKKDSEAYATAVSIAFGGGKKNKDGNYLEGQEPAKLVTPIMANHEFVALLSGNEKSLSDAVKAISDNEGLTDQQKKTQINEAQVAWAANNNTAVSLFETAVNNVERFRDMIGDYRLSEINSRKHDDHFTADARSEKASEYLVANFESLSSVVIGSTVLFSEMGELPTSRCLSSKGCGTVENAIVGTNTADAVKTRIEAILKARQDAPYIDAIRKHLMKTADADAKIVEKIIADLPSTQHSWQTLANAITSVRINTQSVTVFATGKTTESAPKTAQQVLDESILAPYFVK